MKKTALFEVVLVPNYRIPHRARRDQGLHVVFEFCELFKRAGGGEPHLFQTVGIVLRHFVCGHLHQLTRLLVEHQTRSVLVRVHRFPLHGFSPQAPHIPSWARYQLLLAVAHDVVLEDPSPHVPVFTAAAALLSLTTIKRPAAFYFRAPSGNFLRKFLLPLVVQIFPQGLESASGELLPCYLFRELFLVDCRALVVRIQRICARRLPCALFVRILQHRKRLQSRFHAIPVQSVVVRLRSELLFRLHLRQRESVGPEQRHRGGHVVLVSVGFLVHLLEHLVRSDTTPPERLHQRLGRPDVLVAELLGGRYDSTAVRRHDRRKSKLQLVSVALLSAGGKTSTFARGTRVWICRQNGIHLTGFRVRHVDVSGSARFFPTFWYTGQRRVCGRQADRGQALMKHLLQPHHLLFVDAVPPPKRIFQDTLNRVLQLQHQFLERQMFPVAVLITRADVPQVQCCHLQPRAAPKIFDGLVLGEQFAVHGVGAVATRCGLRHLGFRDDELSFLLFRWLVCRPSCGATSASTFVGVTVHDRRCRR
mmetsp:Transcript_17987/g.44916  ORF Transcript_17987/g.44916 Transcript_17987/m.44916 type:complete len:534 (-) Transcript_17987:1968-3569(-)